MEDYFIMAVRRNKDKEIEDLKARNEYLENKTRIFSSWQNLGKREKTSLSLLWVFSLVLVVLAVTLAFLKVTMASEKETDWQKYSSMVDGRRWEASQNDHIEKLQVYFPTFDGTVTTFSTSSSIELILCGSEGDEWFLSFFLREGRMVSFLGSRPIYLRYTESSLGTGRTLSLMVGEDKIVLKEVK